MLELFGLILVTGLAAAYFYTPKPTYYVAYVGRYQRAGSNFDDLHERALRKYLGELNEELPDFRLELKTFDIKVGEGKFDSRGAYGEIAGSGKYVVVIDNTWGSDLSAVAGLIREKGIPVVSINADKQGNDYSNNVVLIGYDDDVPRKVVKFSEKILKNKEVIFVTEDEYKLTARYEEQLRLSGTEFRRVSVKSSTFDAGQEKALLEGLDAEIEELQRRQESPTVILNTHSFWGGPVIEHIDRKYRDIKIVGGPYIVPSSPDYVFGSNDNGNKLIMLTYPHDAVANKVFDDLEGIKVENPAVSKIPNAPLFVKRCLDAVSIVRGAFREGLVRKEAVGKGDFLDFFHDKLAMNVPVTGKYDVYSFDENLLLVDSRSFEEYSPGKVVSYEKQLNPNTDEVMSTIYFGLHDMKVSNVDIKNGSFHAAFSFWIPSSEPDVLDSIRFQNQKTQLKLETFNDRASGYYRVSASGDFNMEADVRRYPFDTQEPVITLRIDSPLSENSYFSFDGRMFGSAGRENKMASDNEWSMEGVRVTADNEIVLMPGQKSQKIRTLNLRMEISRRRLIPFVTIILPLVMIGSFAVAVLYVNDNSFANLGNVCVGIFMGMLTYSFAYMQMIPRSGVLTTADTLFYVTLLTVLLIFLKVIIFNSGMVGERVRGYVSDKTIPIGNVAALSYLLVMAGIVFFG